MHAPVPGSVGAGPPGPRRRPRVLHVVASLLLALALAVATGATARTAGAQGRSATSGERQAATTTVAAEVGPTSECSPGHIVRRPNCGVAPQSPTDPGGWLQVSLFWLVSASVLAIVGLVWWRSKVARDRRRAAGLDPVTLAKARGQGVRRSTRNEPVADSSSKRPEANAGT